MFFPSSNREQKIFILGTFTFITICLVGFFGFHNVRTGAGGPKTDYGYDHRSKRCSTPPPRELVPPLRSSAHNKNNIPLASEGEGEDDYEFGTARAGQDASTQNGAVVSPFANSMAMIRWNNKRMERVPQLMEYAPFFHTVHLSMPDMIPEEGLDFHNLTHDQYPDGETTYIQIARTMRLLLDTRPEIEGLLYFHFDAWIDPLAWQDESRQRIWYPSTENTRIKHHVAGGPRFMCMNTTSDYPGWWWWTQGAHKTALSGLAELRSSGVEYTFKDDEFCAGWSDIYYIPRRYFGDYIYLSHLFGCRGLFHEVAVPTMLHIIDQSRRNPAHPWQSIIHRIGDCWGSCCDSSATAADVRWTRCGHRLDYLNHDVVEAHYGRLAEEAAWLGKPLQGEGSRQERARRRG